MISGDSSVAAISKGKQLYHILIREFGCTHWEARTLLLHRLGFSKSIPSLRQTFKQGRRRVRESNLFWIQNAVNEISTLDPKQQVKWIMRQAWPVGGNPIIEWAAVSDLIVKLNKINKSGTTIRWNGVGRIRRFEQRTAYTKWDEREIGAWLRLEGLVSVTETNYLQCGDADIT